MGSQVREGVSGNARGESICEKVGVVAYGVLAVIALIGDENVSVLELQISVGDYGASV